MIDNKYIEELKYLECFDMSIKTKIKLIETLYNFSKLNFNKFLENVWQNNNKD